MFKPVSTCAFKATVSQFLPLGYLHWGVLFIAVRSSAAHLGVLSLGGGSREVDLRRWISGGGWKFLSYLFRTRKKFERKEFIAFIHELIMRCCIFYVKERINIYLVHSLYDEFRLKGI